MESGTLAIIAKARLGLAFEENRLATLAHELARFDQALAAAGAVPHSADPTIDHRLRLVQAAGR
jgi:hypothetical protein